MAPPTAATPRIPPPPLRDEPKAAPTPSAVDGGRKRPATTSSDATMPVLKRKPLVVQTLLDATGAGVTLRLPSKTDASSQRITPVGKVRKLRHVQGSAKSVRTLPGVGFGTTPRFPRSPPLTAPTSNPSSRAASGFQGWKRARSSTTAITTHSTKPKALKAASTSVPKPPTTPVQASRKPSHKTATTASTTASSAIKPVTPCRPVQEASTTPPAPPRTDNDEATLVSQIVASIQARSCRLVCIDFDKTLLDIHTNGEWTKTAEDLVGHVRPLFVSILPQLHVHGVHLAITTFSPQADLVQRVLQLVLDPTTANAIPVFADNARPSPVEDTNDDDDDASIPAHVRLDKRHKLSYVLSAARHRAVRLGHALLMDDDATNLHDVAAYNVQTLWYEHHESLQSLAAKLSTPTAHTNAHATPVKTAHVAAPRSERVGRPVKPKKQRALVY
ncbi:hypothetical protein SDRG_12418 [Saprolegnia diclina VS20]|uniref:Uncharacterized protein n=1 Tax=Saprolegnia diclina (strain VS20) TaxID=1156394 RepID=T0PWH9_SAPDV|nr:hypothetical protein SDRG_12418 [Saprolegnia diclina VS20]EQC29874.1 hypothetical protein SDRG_12418 [Saprolegnia diclina VS20]|eukprot:XP_008616713.1 hypothetical protein SDRG_12418 [Saprolegnia diclina VS20]